MSVIEDSDERFRTSRLETNYFRPVMGPRARITGSITNLSRSLIHAQADIFNAEDKLAARIYAVQMRGRKTVECQIIGRMNGNQLALKMGRKLRDFDTGIGANAFDFVAIGLAFGGLVEVEQTAVEGGDLDAFVSEIRGPLRDRRKTVEWGFVARKLCQKNCGSFDQSSHGVLPVSIRNVQHQVAVRSLQVHMKIV